MSKKNVADLTLEEIFAELEELTAGDFNSIACALNVTPKDLNRIADLIREGKRRAKV